MRSNKVSNIWTNNPTNTWDDGSRFSLTASLAEAYISAPLNGIRPASRIRPGWNQAWVGSRGGCCLYRWCTRMHANVAIPTSVHTPSIAVGFALRLESASSLSRKVSEQYRTWYTQDATPPRANCQACFSFFLFDGESASTERCVSIHELYLNDVSRKSSR